MNWFPGRTYLFEKIRLRVGQHVGLGVCAIRVVEDGPRTREGEETGDEKEEQSRAKLELHDDGYWWWYLGRMLLPDHRLTTTEWQGPRFIGAEPLGGKEGSTIWAGPPLSHHAHFPIHPPILHNPYYSLENTYLSILNLNKISIYK
jgi:hypothetical protein